VAQQESTRNTSAVAVVPHDVPLLVDSVGRRVRAMRNSERCVPASVPQESLLNELAIEVVPHDIALRVDAPRIGALRGMGSVESRVATLMQQEPIVIRFAIDILSHDVPLGVDAGGSGVLPAIGINERGVPAAVQQESANKTRAIAVVPHDVSLLVDTVGIDLRRAVGTTEDGVAAPVQQEPPDVTRTIEATPHDVPLGVDAIGIRVSRWLNEQALVLAEPPQRCESQASDIGEHKRKRLGWMSKLDTRDMRRLGLWAAIVGVLLPLAILAFVAIYTSQANLSYGDHAALVGTTAAFAAVFLTVEAAIVAILAYWAATQVPDLDIIVGPHGAESADVRLRARTYVDDAGVRIVQPSDTVLKLTLALECRTKVSARHPAVHIEFVGLKVPRPQPGWQDFQNQWHGWTGELQWDGGSDEIVHWRLKRPLPPVSLHGGVIDTQCRQHKLLIDVVADGFHKHDERDLHLDLQEMVTCESAE